MRRVRRRFAHWLYRVADRVNPSKAPHLVVRLEGDVEDVIRVWNRNADRMKEAR